MGFIQFTPTGTGQGPHLALGPPPVGCVGGSPRTAVPTHTPTRPPFTLGQAGPVQATGHVLVLFQIEQWVRAEHVVHSKNINSPAAFQVENVHSVRRGDSHRALTSLTF